MSAGINKANTCGILFCYNEAEVIGPTIQHYLSQNIDLVIFDNQSTDSSADIIKDFLNNSGQYGGRIKDVVTIATKGYEWKDILREANSYMHKNLNNYEWIIITDADTHYASPVKGLRLPEYLKEAGGFGFNILQGRLVTFYPTEKDDKSIKLYSERIKYYELGKINPQEKIFRYHPSIDFYSSYGHECLRDERRVCVNPGFILKHYIWVSYEQGARKVFVDRKPRYPKNFPVQTHYAYLLPQREDFIKDSKTLKYFNEGKELITRRGLLLTEKWVKNNRRNSNAPDKGPLNSAAVSVKAVIPRRAKNFIKYVMNHFRPYPIDPSPGYYRISSDYGFCNMIDKWFTPPLGAAAKNTEALIDSYPSVYHFLMTNFCNAKCVFCNQIDCQTAKEISLEEFKIMASHIDRDCAKEFYFSGGGEPLLCKGLFDIIRHAKEKFPEAKLALVTNGILIEKHAEKIAQSRIDKIIVSMHGDGDINDFILQAKSSKTIFDGIRLLQGYLEKSGGKMDIQFAVVASKVNINEVQKILKKAGELKVNEVSVGFCRYYPHRIGSKLKVEDSLYYHKGLYNSAIRKAAVLAKRLGVRFNYSPPFLKRYKKRQCCDVLNLVLVDWDGNIYPCLGGEVRFYEKVKSGEYFFGNLLKEYVGDFWMNESYVRLRRHLLSSFKENNIPECDFCHNNICIEGPDSIHSHIISPAHENSCF